MKEILLSLFQVFNYPADRTLRNSAGALSVPEWLNKKKHQLFLNPEEIFFGEDWIKIMDTDPETYIDWQEMEFFHYPFVGVNIKLPGFSDSRYFCLIVKEKMENDSLLNEFIGRLRKQTGVYTSRR